MSASISISLSNAVLFVCDPAWYSKERYRPMPEPSRADVVTADDFGMTICCRHEIDGPVAVSIGQGEPEDASMVLQIERPLRTPSGIMAASTVYDDAIVETKCRSPDSVVRVWLRNHANSDRVYIQVRDVPPV